MKTERMHIVFAGGGTAGHLFPGLALAEQLARRPINARITFAGTGKDFERRHCVAAGHDYLPLPCQPLPKRVRGAFRFLIDHLRGYRVAKRFLRRSGVSAVVGLGGYASAPMARAAAALGIPLVLLEQNAVAGRTTRWFASSADVVCASFDKSRTQLTDAGAVRITGNPVRAELVELYGRPRVPQGRRQLLVLGGSGGARTLNEQVPRALYKLRSQLAGWRIVHQCGTRDLAATRELYRKLDVPAQVHVFIDEMPRVLSQTTIALCRSGGTTLAELAVAGVPALLAPYPQAADDHQRANADRFAAAGAAVITDERDASGRFDDFLASQLRELVDNREALSRMSAAMTRLARPDAAWNVAAMISELARVGNRQQVA